MNALRATALILLLVLVGSACASSHQRVVYGGPMTVPLPRDPAERAAIRRANAVGRVQAPPARQGLRIFPSGRRIFASSRPSRIACRIPGPLATPIEGTCQTRVRLKSRSFSGSAIVTFTESWPARRFRTHGPSKGTLHHSWRFLVMPRGARALGSEGAMPPQAAN